MKKELRPKLHVYIVNLEKRTDRRIHSKKEFDGREEFDARFVTPFKHEKGHVSLYKTFKAIVNREYREGSAYFVFCEDDHYFTDAYSREELYAAIDDAQARGADILMGGVSAAKKSVIVSPHLGKVDFFNGTQFCVVFNKFYKTILYTNMKETEHGIDWFISYLSDDKYVSVPFISKQARFDYSDCCPVNDKNPDRVQQLFDETEKRMLHMKRFTASAHVPL